MSFDPVARQIATEALTTAQSATSSVFALSNGDVVDGDFTASVGQVIDADTSAASWTLTLPEGGGTVVVRDYAGTWETHPLTISGNGALIAGAATFVLDATGFQVTFTMIDGAWFYALQYLYGAA